ncbi:hypothetical protein K9K77_02250 [Candidatus Babeliales bacterium]|nr:hypothetical protein [Candidatus Babeliales bacterium]
MKKIIVIGLLPFFMYCSDIHFVSKIETQESVITRPRTKRIQKSTGDIKQAIAKEYDDILTSCLSSINSLTELIDGVRKKIKALVSCDDDFFSKKKHSELEQYKKDIQAMKRVVQEIEIRLDKEIKNLDTNFSKK